MTYKVTDKTELLAKKTIYCNCETNTGDLNSAPIISANDVTLNVGDTFDPLANVTATDKEDGTIILTKDNIIANDVDTSKAGTYHVTFRVVDKNGAITEKTITVTVKEKVTNKPVSPQQPQKPSKPTTPTKPSGQKNPVKTGDMTNVGLFTSMFAGSTGVLAVLLTTKHTQEDFYMTQVHFTLKSEEIQSIIEYSVKDDVSKNILTTVFNQLMENQRTEYIQAKEYERTENRQSQRNGYYERSFTTRVGTLELKVPRTRDGHFSPTVFERYQRNEKALMASMLEMYVSGVSTRKVSKIVEELCGKSVSKSSFLA